MSKKSRNIWVCVLVIVLVLFFDQLLKIWVKTHMSLYQVIDITPWFKLNFVENNGMAFGIEAGSKFFLSIFRIVAVFLIIYYLTLLVKQRVPMGFIVAVALILAGASGNIFDSIFYGAVFEASYPGYIAHVVPWGQGYSSVLHGKVVDMLYFPLFDGSWPSWMPFIGGKDFLFFRFIFNIADASITIGVLMIVFFYGRVLSYSFMSDADREKAIKKHNERKAYKNKKKSLQKTKNIDEKEKSK